MLANQYHSYNLGALPAGCQYCVRGEKLVLFVTGICPRRCYFCPISDAKFGKDVVFANEREIQNTDDVLAEAKAMNARGAGITGGDPLAALERTVSYIRLLKEKQGKEFHIHLYTSLNLVSEEVLAQLHHAGLDEIRFHLDLESETLWPRLELARTYSWSLGVELPVIPAKKEALCKAMDFVQDKVDFVTLNELEVADNSQSLLLKMGYTTKDRLSYAIRDSLKTGFAVMDYVKTKKYPLSLHLCTAKLKDSVQLANRLKREAQGVRKSFDLVDSEGLLTRGALYLPELAPGFKYRERLAGVNRTECVEKLRDKLETIQKFAGDLFLDEQKPRILLASKLIRQHRREWKKLGLMAAIVKEYPTADQLEIEVEFV